MIKILALWTVYFLCTGVVFLWGMHALALFPGFWEQVIVCGVTVVLIAFLGITFYLLSEP